MKTRLIFSFILLLGLCGFLKAEEPVRQSGKTANSEAPATRTMSIHKTGFLSKKVTVITYLAESKKVISVEVNGKQVPEKDFGKYEKMVKESREYLAYESLEPDFNSLKKLLDDPKVSNREKMKAIDNLLEDFKDKNVDESSIFVSHLDILKMTVNSEILREEILAIMQEADSSWVEEVYTAEFKKGLCTINNTKLSKELSKRIYEVYELHNNRTIDKDETVMYYF